MLKKSKIKKVVTSYIEERIKDIWAISDIIIYTGTYGNGQKKVYVEFRHLRHGTSANNYFYYKDGKCEIEELDEWDWSYLKTNKWFRKDFKEYNNDDMSLIDQIKEVVKK